MRLDENFIKEHTKDWKLIDSEGPVELWQFFDQVAWAESYALKVNGEIKMEIEDSTQAYFAVEVAAKVLE